LTAKTVYCDHQNSDITLIHNEQNFYEERWHARDLSETEEQRIDVTISSIPSSCNAILDIGCGDGRLSGRISRSRKVIAYDLSITALKRSPSPKCCGSAHQLPFRDRSFDLVLSTEMLEHLPPRFYCSTIEEMARVANKYILITVPNSENLDENIARCATCNSRFHVWGHLRSFEPHALRALFIGFVPLRIFPFGPTTETYNKSLLWIRTRVAGGFAWEEGCVCHFCRATVQPSSPSLVSRCCNFLNTRLWAPYKRRTSWLLALYERQR